MIRILTAAGIFWAVFGQSACAATTQKRYYAHNAVEDQYGVIAPWYKGQNGQLDLRARVSAELLKRYPWVDKNISVMAGPDYIFNGIANVDASGAICVFPATDHLNGDIGQRFKYVTMSIPKYYRYTGDPTLLSHLKIAADFVLGYYMTSSDHPWPKFPISVPLKGKPYGPAKAGGYIQLDLSANAGTGFIRAYQLTGEDRYLDAARHCGDVFARKCNYQPGASPWNRYASPAHKSKTRNIQTGGVSSILLFLDELIRLGYTGQDGAIVKARDAGRAYLRDTLLPAWTFKDTWGRHYWDWEHDAQGIVVTAWVSQYLMDNKDAFPNWQNDIRNIMGIFLNHACVNPKSNGDVYSGAWAHPESCTCCGRSLDYCPVYLGRYTARYGFEADSLWARELARREIILGTYNFHESGMVEDNIDGGQITAKHWSEIVTIGGLLCALDCMAWLPEEFGAARENHLMRSSAVVTSVVYAKGKIEYSTFDAPANTVDVLRLAFKPTSITADGKPLSARSDLDANGYTIKSLPCSDSIVTIRHDGKKSIVVTGDDPQNVADNDALQYMGTWTVAGDAKDFGSDVRATDAKDAAAACKFKGNQVRLIGRVGPAGGLADVYLDGVKQLSGFDCWHPSTTRHQQVLYHRNGLSNGPHELKIVARGAKNAYSGGCNVYVDAVQSSAATGNSGFGSGGGPTHPQRMIFGYTARKPYIDSSGNPWRPATEFVVRTGHHTDSVAKTWWTKPSEQSITGSDDPQLYRHGVHAPEFWANVTVGPGKYKVRLKFAERRSQNDPKCRPMNVSINGRQVVKSLDVAAKAGGLYKAVDLSFDKIRPKNGTIEIRFNGTVGGEAMVQAIEVTPELDAKKN